MMQHGMGFWIGASIGDNRAHNLDNDISPHIWVGFEEARTVQTIEFWGAHRRSFDARTHGTYKEDMSFDLAKDLNYLFDSFLYIVIRNNARAFY